MNTAGNTIYDSIIRDTRVQAMWIYKGKRHPDPPVSITVVAEMYGEGFAVTAFMVTLDYALEEIRRKLTEAFEERER